jgi:hypothetical protein
LIQKKKKPSTPLRALLLFVFGDHSPQETSHWLCCVHTHPIADADFVSPADGERHLWIPLDFA